MGGEEDKTLQDFQIASELPLEAYGKAKMDLLEMLEQVGRMGKEYRGEGEGIKAHIRLGPFEASFETVPQPKVSSYRGVRQPQKPKPLNLLGAQNVVAEYPNILKQPEETPEFWWIGLVDSYKKLTDEEYRTIKQKLLDVGFVYEKWQKDTPHTKGWRGKK